jgi:hypothetical protein
MPDDFDTSKGFPVLVPLELRGGRGDLTIIQHHYNFNNNPFINNGPNMGNSQMMMLEMNRAMIETQRLLLEQRKIDLFESTTKAALGQAHGDSPGIEYKGGKEEDNIITHNKNDKAIEGTYEIVDENKQPNNQGEEKVKMENHIEEETKLDEINKSISRQIKSDSEPPYFVEGKIVGITEGSIVFAPVVFTVLNEIWRDRVRYIMRECYYDNTLKSIKRLKNQSNESAVIVILYNSKIEPVEMLSISQLGIKEYMCNRVEFNELKNTDLTILSLNRLVNTVIKSFGIKLTNYFHLYEPCIKEDTPYVLIQKDNNAFKADAVRLKPVLSFDKKEQLVSFDTYCRSIISRGYIQH